MKVSIITACFNSSKTILDTLDSVSSQSWKNIEHIVVDGKSSDGTCELIKKYGKQVSKFISEKDHGIYDAMNKGINESSGDIIGFLNSDDFFSNDSIVEEYIKAFSEKKIDACFGDVLYVTDEERNKCTPVRNWISSSYQKKNLLRGWIPPHPTFYARKEVYDELGGFDTNLRFAADYEVMCRFLLKGKILTKYLPGTKVNMRLGGHTNKSIGNIYKGNKEIINSLKRNGISPGPSFFFFKAMNRFNQLLKKTSDI